MGYEDFVYFILSEEDKTNSISLDYWFKCIDLDCDGSLRANEMLVSSWPHVHLPVGHWWVMQATVMCFAAQ